MSSRRYGMVCVAKLSHNSVSGRHLAKYWGCQSLTYNRSGLLDQHFLPEVMRGQLNVTNTDEF